MTMSVQRDALKKEYEFLILAGGDRIAKDFQTKCIDLLEGLNVNHCFKFLPFGEICNAFFTKAKQENKLAKFENLEDVIKHLEKYAQNILTKPWCKDFYTINISNGFFKYKIEQWIPVEIACKVLKLIGYQLSDESPGIYKIEKLDVHRLSMIGFELYLGHTQLFAFRSSPYLANYPLDQIMKAHNETTGDPIKIIEWIKQNNSLMERPCDISETLQETAMSNRVTTAFQHEYFDKNGQSTQEAVRYPPNETNFVGFMEYPSLSSAEILDKELYGDEPDSIVQDSYQKRAATYSHTRNPVEYSAQRGFRSLPVPPESTKDWSSNSNIESESDLRRSIFQRSTTRSSPMKEQFKNHLSKQASGQENAFAVARGQSTTTPNSSSEDDGLYVEPCQPYNNNAGVPECVVYQNVEYLSGMANHEVSRGEKLGQTKDQRVDKILNDRIKAGEENMYQKPSTPNHCAESVVADASKMLENQCYICSNISVIGCEKCGKIVCKDCLKVLRKAPCISLNENHTYSVLDSKDTLNNKDTGLSAVSQVSKIYQNHSGVREQLTGMGLYQKPFLHENHFAKSVVADVGSISHEDHEYYSLDSKDTKWQCKHCTYINSPETTVCVACSRSKDFIEPPLTTGDWVCDNCTLVNPSSLKQCNACKDKKSCNTYI